MLTTSDLRWTRRNTSGILPYSMPHFIRWIVICGLAALSSAQASKVLLIAAQTYSHCAEVSSVGQELVNRGHNVSILFTVTYDHKNCHLKGAKGTKRINTIPLTPTENIATPSDILATFSNALVEDEEFSVQRRLGTMTKCVSFVCENILSDIKTLTALKAEKFDLAIDGAFMTYCFFAVPHFLKVPYVAVSTFFEDFVSGRPFLPSISPDVLSHGTDKMTFFQRMKNAVSQIVLYVIVRYTLPMGIVSDLTPELSRQDIINLVSQSELFLYNYDNILSYPLPTMPNHVLIGGVGTRPAQSLTGELKEYYEQSPDGVVVVTFGGNALNLTQSKVKTILRVLQKLNFNVVWKYGDGGQYGNVKQMKWVPQNDLLGHPNTKLFVSHCGNNGVYEALYHGVPLVCTPILGDQFFNGVRVKLWEVGVTTSLMTSTEDELYDAIIEVLSNPKYKKNMQRASQMFHSQPKPPRERAADAIEYVLKFGGDHLRSRASDMSVFTYMGYDIVCFVSAVILCISFIFVRGVWLLCKWCRTTVKEKTS